MLPASLAWAQAYGRFGFRSLPNPPGFSLDEKGFRVAGVGADLCRFAAPLHNFKPTAVNDRKVVFQGPVANDLPSILRTNLAAPGFDGLFGSGFSLRFLTNLSPLLSWADGTVDGGLPTPESKWALLSFEDAQPPVLLVFDQPVALVVSGKPGEWKLSTTKPYKGWVRFCLPYGQKKVKSTAHDLGVVTASVAQHEKFWTGAPPELVSVDVKQESDHIVAVWTFDRPGAVVPVGVLFAHQGGYPLRSLTGVVETDGDLFEGPVAYCPETKMSITFPCRRVPLGRPLVVGSTIFDLPATVSGLDLDGVANLALASFCADRPESVVDMLRGVSDEYAHGLLAAREPVTDSPQPLGADGSGIDLLAAHGLAVQSAAWGEGQDSQRNPWLADVLKRRDWWTWTLAADDLKQARRAAALACVAAELCPEIDRRLSAAMLNAGLAAQSVLPAYRARRGFPVLTLAKNPPLERIRHGLFSEGPALLAADRTLATLFAGLRVLSPTPVHVTAEKNGYVLWWEPATAQPSDLLLASAWPIDVEPRQNLASVVPQPAVGATALRFIPKGRGACSVFIKFPKYAEPLPLAAAPYTLSD